MANYKNVRKSKEVILVDKETGDIEDKVMVTDTPVRTAEDYVKSFTSYVYELATKLSAIEFVVFFLLSHNGGYNTNSFQINKSIKSKICEAMNITETRLRNIICELSRKNVLIREERGKYIIDPKYLFKGTEDGRVTVNITIGQINMSCDVSNQTGSVTINPVK